MACGSDGEKRPTKGYQIVHLYVVDEAKAINPDPQDLKKEGTPKCSQWTYELGMKS
jgi:hypothetical protein